MLERSRLQTLRSSAAAGGNKRLSVTKFSSVLLHEFYVLELLSPRPWVMVFTSVAASCITFDEQAEREGGTKRLERDAESPRRLERLDEVAHHVHLRALVQLRLDPDHRVVEQVERTAALLSRPFHESPRPRPWRKVLENLAPRYQDWGRDFATNILETFAPRSRDLGRDLAAKFSRPLQACLETQANTGWKLNRLNVSMWNWQSRRRRSPASTKYARPFVSMRGTSYVTAARRHTHTVR